MRSLAEIEAFLPYSGETGRDEGSELARVRTKAATRGKDAGRSIAGAIVAGIIYDVAKIGATRMWEMEAARSD